MTFRVLFAPGVSPRAGLGHLSRCRNLALSLQGEGGCIHWCLPAAARDLGLPELPGRISWYADTIPSPTLDLPDHDWRVFDNYDLRAEDLAAWAQRPGRQALLDDCMIAGFLSCDLLVNSAGGVTAEVYEQRSRAQLLLGPEFAPLHPDFAAESSAQEGADALLVSFGGSDAQGFGWQLMQQLHRVPEAFTAFPLIHFVVGPLQDWAVFTQCHASLPEPTRARVQLHFAPNGLLQLMERSRCVLCSGGVTLLEANSREKPAAVLIQARNQEAPARALAAAGACEIWPQTLLQDGTSELGERLRRLYRAGCQRVCDGRGASRIIRQMRQLSRP